jgi:hypothetical protein
LTVGLLGLLAEESAISQRGRLGKEKPLSLAAPINITPTLIKMDLNRKIPITGDSDEGDQDSGLMVISVPGSM